MIALLRKLFIKGDLELAEERKKTGVLCSFVGIGLNILLAIGKYIAGLISGSIAIIADAANNLSDAGSSIVTLIGFKLASKKPDSDHPFGHGRAEYISGFIVSVSIILMGFEIGKSSFGKILHPEEMETSIIAIIILIASILVKLYMFMYNHSYGKRLEAPAMLATAADSRNDMIATGLVLVSLLIYKFTGVNLDGYFGFVVAVVILISGYNTAKDMISPLLGNPPTKEFVDTVEEVVMSHEQIIGMHDLIVHDYGPNRVMLSLHAEVPGDGDIFELHDEIDVIEHELREKLQCHAVIHMDPIDNKSETVKQLREIMTQIVISIDERITLHDFRIVAGPTHTNILFDIVLPFDMQASEKEILKDIFEKAQEENPTYITVVDVDYAYV